VSLRPDSADDPPRRVAGGRAARVVLQCLIGGAFLAIFLMQVDPRAIAGQIGAARPWPVLFALLSYGVAFTLRAVRFWVLLNGLSARRLPWRQVPAPFIASFGISDLLPLRAGDVFRLLWFQRRMALPAGIVLGAMLIERCCDVLALILLAVGVLVWQTGAAWLPYLVLMAAAGLAALFAFGRLGRRVSGWMRGHRWRWMQGLGTAIDTFAILRSPRMALTLLGLSLICWVLESVVMLGAWVSLGGMPGQWGAPMAAFVTSTLGTLIPGLPGHFGTFELFGLEMFRRSGIAPAFAAAVLLLAHLLLWAPTALFAVVWLPFSGVGQQRPQPDEATATTAMEARS
jgi:uncharacterized protein (TIRG00374 family)